MLYTQLRHNRHVWIAGVLGCLAGASLAGILLFYHLGAEPLQNYDESFYAQMARESLAHGSLITPSYAGVSYIGKPPLALWLMEASTKLIPDPELAARLPSAIAGFLLVCLVMLFTYEVSRSPIAAAFAGLVLTTTGAFIEAARQARVDIILVFFIVLAVYAFWKGLHHPRWFLLSGASLAGAIMTKDVVALFALAAALPLMFAARTWHWYKSRYVLAGVALCLALIAPWHIYQTLQFGSQFWQTYIGHEVIARTKSVFFTLQPTNLGYLSYLFSFAFPWPYMFLASAGVMLALWEKTSRPLRILFLSSCSVTLAVLIVCFVVQTKAFSYLLPLYPFLAIAIAACAGALWTVLPSRERFLLALGLCLCLVFGVYTTFYNGWHLNPYYQNEIELAREERTIGFTIAHADPLPAVYATKAVDLNSVIFYSGQHPQILTATTAPALDSLILLPVSERAQFSERHPTLSTKMQFDGKKILLLQVLSED